MSPRKVLFVEDEAALQYSYKRFFKGKYSMAYAPNGAEAMRQLDAFQPDVLVLDMRLPIPTVSPCCSASARPAPRSPSS